MRLQDLLRIVLFSAVSAAGPAYAAEYGTAAEARSMLERAVAALRQDKTAALASFNKGERGFRDRDLYPFCAGPDGTVTAHSNPTEVGKNLKQIKDKQGKAFGEEMFKIAEPGKTKEVTYRWFKPGGTKPVRKVSYVTRVGDQLCGVGYYPQ